MLSRDTEYFNGKDWKCISEYTSGEKVLQYNEDGTSELVIPTDYIHVQNSEVFYENNIDDLPVKISENGKVVVDKNGSLSTMSFGEVLSFVSKREDTGVFIPVFTQMKDSEFSITLSDTVLQRIVEGYKSNTIPKNSAASLFLRKIGFGKVTFSDKVYMLSEFQRQKLLREILNIKEGQFVDTLLDNYVLLTGSNSLIDAQMVTSLSHVTKGFSKVGYDWCRVESRVHDEVYLKMLSVPDITVSQITAGIYDKDTYDDIIITSEIDKYNFIVPSHMLVLRRKGCVFITGDYYFKEEET